MGLILTTYKSWDVAPHRKIRLKRSHLLHASFNSWSEVHIFSDPYDKISKWYESFQRSCWVVFAHYPIHMFLAVIIENDHIHILTQSMLELMIFRLSFSVGPMWSFPGGYFFPLPWNALDPESAIKFPQQKVWIREWSTAVRIGKTMLSAQKCLFTTWRFPVIKIYQIDHYIYCFYIV